MTTHDRPTEYVGATSETGRRLLAAIGDDFEIRRLLGEGGFAEVYAAWDPTLNREVAIQALRAEHGSSPDLLSRFRAEAEAIARLQHPQIVPIYTVAEREGIAWFVMPKVSGVSLADVLERGTRWSCAEGSRVIREAATALAAAHRAGIVHRSHPLRLTAFPVPHGGAFATVYAHWNTVAPALNRPGISGGSVS